MNYTSLILTGIDEVLLSSPFSTLTNTTTPSIVEVPDHIGYTKTFWIALGVSVITNLAQAFALTFQRRSHLLNDAIFPREDRKSVWKRPMWLFAFLSFITANIIGSVFSIGYLPIVILAPIGAMNIVFNMFVSNLVLGDPLSKQGILGTGLIAVGALLVGFFGVIPEPNHSLKDLIVLYKNSGFIIYFTILETLIILVILTTHYLEYRCNKIEAAFHLLQASQKTKLYGYTLHDLKRYIGISYGILSGNVSSQSMLFAKSGIELIILFITSDENQLRYPLTWFLLAMMISGAMQLFYLNKGLRLCDTMTLIPLSFCAFNVSCLFNGLVYYNQWDRFRWWQLMYVMFGVVITIFGVLLLSWQQKTVAAADTNNTNNKSNATTDEIGTLVLSENEEEGSSIISTITTFTSIDSLDDVDQVDDDYNDSYDIKSNLLVKKNKKNKHETGTIRLY